MAIRRRTCISLAAIAAVLVFVLIVFIPVLLTVDRFRPRLIADLEARTGKQVEIGRLSFTFYPTAAIRVDDFGIRNPTEIFPPGYFIRVKRMDATFDARALLHRRIVLESLVLHDPEINLVSDPDGPWNFENPHGKSPSGPSPLGVIPRVEIEGGHLIVSDLLPSDAPGPVFFEVRDISCSLANVDLASFADPSPSSVPGQGSLRADTFRFGKVHGSNITSSLRLLGRKIDFTDLTGTTYGGNAWANLSFDLAGRDIRWNAHARMTGVDVAPLLAAFPNGSGKMSGKMDGELRLAGDVEHTDRPLAGIHGTGQVTVRNGEVPSVRLNESVMQLAHFNNRGPAARDPGAFYSITADLKIAEQRISSSRISVIGYGVNVQGSGNLSVTGSGALAYQGVAEIMEKQGFFANLFARLSGVSVVDGRLTFPFHVNGTLDAPRFARGGTSGD